MKEIDALNLHKCIINIEQSPNLLNDSSNEYVEEYEDISIRYKVEFASVEILEVKIGNSIKYKLIDILNDYFKNSTDRN